MKDKIENVYLFFDEKLIQRVILLYMEGMTIITIASIVGAPIGDVNLILDEIIPNL